MSSLVEYFWDLQYFVKKCIIYCEYVNLGEPNEERRFELLITLLFDTEEEKDIYRERYECNTRIMELVDGLSTDLTHELISINSERKLRKNII